MRFRTDTLISYPKVSFILLIQHHKIREVVYGVLVDFVGGFTSAFEILSTEKIPEWGSKPKVTGGVLEDECRQLSRQFELQQKETK